MLSDNPVFPILLSLDLDATRTFYHDVLGLEILREDPDDRILFRCGGGTLCVKIMWGEELNANSHWYRFGIDLLGTPVEQFLPRDNNSGA